MLQTCLTIKTMGSERERGGGNKISKAKEGKQQMQQAAGSRALKQKEV